MMLSRRRELVRRYARLLRDIPGLIVPVEPEGARSNWQSYCVRLPEGSDQRQVMQLLLDLGIATRLGIMCAHREASYPRSAWRYGSHGDVCGSEEGGPCSGLRESERAQDECILLPLFHELTELEQGRVAEGLRRALAGGAARETQ